MTPTVRFLLAIEATAAVEIIIRGSQWEEYTKMVISVSASLTREDWSEWTGRSPLSYPVWKVISDDDDIPWTVPIHTGSLKDLMGWEL